MQCPSVAMIPAVVALNVNASFLKSTNKLSRLGNVDVDEAANDSLYPESTEDWTFLLDTSSTYDQDRGERTRRQGGGRGERERGEMAKDTGKRERKKRKKKIVKDKSEEIERRLANCGEQV